MAGFAVVTAFMFEMPLQHGIGAPVGLLLQLGATGVFRCRQQRRVYLGGCCLADAVMAQLMFAQCAQVLFETLALLCVAATEAGQGDGGVQLGAGEIDLAATVALLSVRTKAVFGTVIGAEPAAGGAATSTRMMPVAVVELSVTMYSR